FLDIKHRIQTYGMPVDLLKTFGASDIPETETLFAGSLDFFKIAGSAGIAYEKPIVSSETFSWMKKDLMTNPIKWKVACDRLIVSGINQIVYHGWSYQPNPDKYPGHYSWRGHGFSEDLSPHSLYWKYYPILNGYVSRLQYIFQQGETVANVGIFYDKWNYTYKHLANEELEDGTLPGFDVKRVSGPISWFKRRSRSELDKHNALQQELGHQLMEMGYYYIHLNAELLTEKSEIVGNKLKIGSAELDALIFIEQSSINYEVIQRFDEIINAGIKIIFINQLPTRQSGYLNYKRNDKLVRDKINELQDHGLDLISDNIHLGKYLKSKLNIRSDLTFNQSESDFHYIHQRIGHRHFYFIRSGIQYSRNVSVIFNVAEMKGLENDKNFGVYELDLWTGDILKFDYLSKTSSPSSSSSSSSLSSLSFNLKFGPYESKLFMIYAEKDTPVNYDDNVQRYQVLQDINPIRLQSWNLKVEKRDVNGQTHEIDLNLSKLKDWRKIKNLKYCSGPGHYTTTFNLWKNEEIVMDPNVRVFLDLGKVNDVAEISINNEHVATLLVPYYQVDITDYISETEGNIHTLINDEIYLKITVTGTLQNRFVGYGKQHEDWKTFKRRILMPLGLIGPVRIVLKRLVNP
ncbi:MAG: hypothetical protein GF364_01080, partial [Candidatus Lokiarchaeota archaeon]|nr:hypothetical protein [Candidatus Lokiarchaeota archaeon]